VSSWQYLCQVAIEVRVERARCIASKACINGAPGTFELDPTLVSRVIDPEGDPHDDVISAAESCPTGAISVWKDGSRIA